MSLITTILKVQMERGADRQDYNAIAIQTIEQVDRCGFVLRELEFRPKIREVEVTVEIPTGEDDGVFDHEDAAIYIHDRMEQWGFKPFDYVIVENLSTYDVPALELAGYR
jgi:hypothetical protein